MPKRRITNYRKDRRPKHYHWLVTVMTYTDNETFGRADLDREKAEKFAARQKKSPVLLKTRIRQLS